MAELNEMQQYMGCTYTECMLAHADMDASGSASVNRLRVAGMVKDKADTTIFGKIKALNKNQGTAKGRLEPIEGMAQPYFAK